MRFDLRTCVVPGLVAVLVLTAGCTSGGQQGLVLTPSLGVHRPGENVYEVATGTDPQPDNALALGLNLETGPLRGSLLYATGATISRSGVGGESQVGDATVLGVAGSLVFRPLGGSVLQPYLLGGVGMKQLRYSFDDDSLDDLPDRESEAALHFGGGIALTLGRIGVMIELTDLMGFENREFGRHDTFLMAGVRLLAF